MARNTMTNADMAEVAAGLRRLLDAIRDGTLTAGSGEVARLEGALAAVESLSGDDAAGRTPRLG